MRILLFTLLAASATAADFAEVKPNALPPDDPRAKELSRMLSGDARKRMRDANLRESQAFARLGSKAQWEAFRDPRIAALRESLGAWPEPPANPRLVVTRTLEGDGYQIQNVLFESRPGLWVAANLYLPAKPPEKMPGILLSHSHHSPKMQGELQDMGMTWARTGCAVLVPDHLGYGERRLHDFRTAKDYPKPFQTSRQDYYFRYNTNLQLSTIGDSLLGWMVWDLMRGVDVLLKQPTIDPNRILLLGAVAGGGDPAGVTAALDPRIAAVVPFNFGGWQPESSVSENPDRDFPWFGEGYWESTRGLRGGAKFGFSHPVIVGSIAPRRLLYAHEFAWDSRVDPAWPRLQTIFGFYNAADRLRFAHGSGSLKGQPPESSHCNNIGAFHRKMIHPAFKEWFGIPIPTEFSQRRTSDELTCWTNAARAELQPQPAYRVMAALLEERSREAKKALAGGPTEKAHEILRGEWAKLLGNTEPAANPKVEVGPQEAVAGGVLSRFILETEPGILVPGLLIVPKGARAKVPVVVMVAQGGKAAFLKERSEAIGALLNAGVAVCLADVRGTGETRPGDGSASRGSNRTSISQTELILGQPLLAAQLRDLRSVLKWLESRDDLDGQRLAVWGDSFTPPNAVEATFAAPLDAPDLPRIAEPGGANLALLAALFDSRVKRIYTHGGVLNPASILESAYLYVPHESVVPGAGRIGGFAELGRMLGERWIGGPQVDARNRTIRAAAVSPDDAVKMIAAAWNRK